MKRAGIVGSRAASEDACYLQGWGVFGHLLASSPGLLESAVAGLPKGFRVVAKVRRKPCFELRLRPGLIEFNETRLPFRSRSKAALRAAVTEALERLSSTDSATFSFLHAGAVEIDGKVVLLPGHSKAGKSTLVAAFLRKGAAYLSDDLVPIDKDLRAHPFPRPIGIRADKDRMPTRTRIEDFGGSHAKGPRPIALIWCGAYDPRRARPSFKRRRGRHAFAELLPHSPGARTRPEVVVPILSGLARSVPVFTGARGDAEAMVEAILNRIDRTRSQGLALANEVES